MEGKLLFLNAARFNPALRKGAAPEGPDYQPFHDTLIKAYHANAKCDLGRVVSVYRGGDSNRNVLGYARTLADIRSRQEAMFSLADIEINLDSLTHWAADAMHSSVNNGVDVINMRLGTNILDPNSRNARAKIFDLVTRNTAHDVENFGKWLMAPAQGDLVRSCLAGNVPENLPVIYLGSEDGATNERNIAARHALLDRQLLAKRLDTAQPAPATQPSTHGRKRPRLVVG